MGLISSLKKSWIIRTWASAGNFSGPSEYDPITDGFVNKYKPNKWHGKTQDEGKTDSKKRPLRIIILWWLCIAIVSLLWLMLCLSVNFIWGWIRIFLFWILMMILILFFLRFVRWIGMFLLFIVFIFFMFIFPYLSGHKGKYANISNTNSVQGTPKWEGPCFVPWCTRAPSDFSKNISAYIGTKKDIPNYCCLTVTRETNGTIGSMIIDETPLFNLYWADYADKYFKK